MFRALKDFLMKEPVLLIAGLAAAISCFFVPPSMGYLAYFDWRTMVLLYTLMVAVACWREARFFRFLAGRLCRRSRGSRQLGVLLTVLCFFSSMVVTNDVALLTFVPFTLLVLDMGCRRGMAIPLVVMETVAANLGSILTPVGNPQNLFLSSHYAMGLGEFFAVTGPLTLISLLLCMGLCIPLFPSDGRGPVDVTVDPMDGRMVLLGTVVFAASLAVVVRLLPWTWLLAGVLVLLGAVSPRTLSRADFGLIATFACFFVFVGNLQQIPAIRLWLEGMLKGREFLVSVSVSQVISNVPAAVLLSGFTDRAAALVAGTNVGGLGTPVASLASLISLKIYMRERDASMGRFLLVFTAVNGALLAVLTAATLWMGYR